MVLHTRLWESSTAPEIFLTFCRSHTTEGFFLPGNTTPDRQPPDKAAPRPAERGHSPTGRPTKPLRGREKVIFQGYFYLFIAKL